MKLMLGGIDYFSLENELFLEALRAFYKREFSTENLNFLEAVRGVKEEKDPQEVARKVNLIYTQYIFENAPNQVNLPSDIRVKLEKNQTKLK